MNDYKTRNFDGILNALKTAIDGLKYMREGDDQVYDVYNSFEGDYDTNPIKDAVISDSIDIESFEKKLNKIKKDIEKFRDTKMRYKSPEFIQSNLKMKLVVNNHKKA